MSYEKQLFETEDGKLYYTNDLGEVFEIKEDNKDKKTQTHEEKLEEIAEVRLDYLYLQSGITWLRKQMRDSAKQHGIELPSTRKDIIDDLRERKNSKWREKNNNITEDITSKEFRERKKETINQFNPNLSREEQLRIFKKDLDIDEEVVETLKTIEKSIPSMKLKNRKSYNLII